MNVELYHLCIWESEKLNNNEILFYAYQMLLYIYQNGKNKTFSNIKLLVCCGETNISKPW